jgi:hypothetical protein
MPIPKLSLHGTETVTHRRRVAESINDIIDFKNDDWRRKTAAEQAAGITPTNYAYQPGDPFRYGAVGDDSDDTTAVQAALTLAADHPALLNGRVYRVTSALEVPTRATVIGPGTIRVDHDGVGLKRGESGIARCFFKNIRVEAAQDAEIAWECDQFQYCQWTDCFVGSVNGSAKFDVAFKFSNVAYWNVQRGIEIEAATRAYELEDANDSYFYGIRHVRFSGTATHTVYFTGGASGIRFYGLSCENIYQDAEVISFHEDCEMCLFVGLRIECRSGSSNVYGVRFNGATDNAVIDPYILGADTTIDGYGGNLVFYKDGFGGGIHSLGYGTLILPHSEGDPSTSGAINYRSDTDKIRAHVGGGSRTIPVSPAVEAFDLNGQTISNVGTLVLSGAASDPGSGKVALGNGTATTVGAAGGASALPATPLGYLIGFVGTTQVKIPYYTAS